MRILFIAPHPFFQERGTPIAVRLALRWMASAGHQVTLLTFPEGEDLELPGLSIIRVRGLQWARNVKPGFSWKKLLYDALIYQQAKRLLGEHPYQLIHAVEESAFIARRVGRKHGIPYVYDMDSSLAQQMCEKLPALRPVRGLFEAAERGAIRGAIGVLPVCRAIEDIVREAEPGKLVQRLEDISLLEPSSGAPEPDQLLTAEQGVIKLLYVGNLEAYQGIDLLLEAFRAAVRKNTSIRLYIVGGAASDIERYRNRVQADGLTGQVELLGPRPSSDLAVYLEQADILVSARSKGINTPMKIYSYLDSGRVVLATRMLTHTQVMDDEIACLVEPDPDSMAEGILRLASDNGLREKLAAAARAKVQQEFSSPAYERKLADFYQRVEQKIQT